MPAYNSMIENETVESFSRTRVVAAIRFVPFDRFCKGFHLQGGQDIAVTVAISWPFGKDAEHNKEQRGHED
jgi:hypothetical protein